MLDQGDILKYNMVELKYAYPIIIKDINNKIIKINTYFNQFKNLRLIGRSTTFEYLHTHHILERSEKLVKQMVS